MALTDGMTNPNGRRQRYDGIRDNSTKKDPHEFPSVDDRSADDDSESDSDDVDEGFQPQDTSSCATDESQTSTSSWWKGIFGEEPSSSSKGIR